MKIVVTGAMGLVGRHLVPALAADHEVWALTRDPEVPAPGSRVTWVEADLAAPQLPAALPAQADVVVHLAQSSHYREWPEQALDVFNVNVASTARLLNWGRRAGIRQFVLASTGAVESPALAGSYYVRSRQCAELLAGGFADQFRVLVARFFFVYGPGQKRSMFVPRLVDTIRAGGTVTLAGEHGPRFNPVHVDDAVAGMMAAIRDGESGVLPVAGPDEMTVREIADAIGRHMQTPARFAEDANQPVHDLVGDVSRLRQLVGRPLRPFADGVRDLVSGA